MQLREDVFSLCQMRTNSIMQFFAVCKDANNWTGTDLNEQKTLFFAFVAVSQFKSILIARLDSKTVAPSQSAVPRTMLDAVMGTHPNYGAHLVELNTKFSMISERIVKPNLDPVADHDLLCRYELTGMLGSVDKLKKRILRYVDIGVNWDDQKSFLFPGITLPPPDTDWVPCESART
jgi:hypothetical protein